MGKIVMNYSAEYKLVRAFLNVWVYFGNWFLTVRRFDAAITFCPNKKKSATPYKGFQSPS
jgi:hypothetical protein